MDKQPLHRVRYPYSTERDRENLEGSDYRTLRSGSWNLNSYNVRAAFRYGYTPDDRFDHVGLRLVVSTGQ